MPAIKDRGDGNAKRKDRLAKIKKGPGVFVYDGEAIDVEFRPTPLLLGKDEPVLDEAGLPVIDANGSAVYRRSGAVVRDMQGRVVLGGVPKRIERKIDVFEIRGVAFFKGERVEVTDEQLAVKLRGMDHFEEVEPEAEAPKKRGRPAKSESAETTPDKE